MSIADNIKRLRESHGMSQSEFGKIAGVTDKAVSTWENGLKIPRMGAVQKIADFFHITKSEILDDHYERVDLPQSFTSPVLQSLADSVAQLNEEGQEKLVEYADDLVSSGKYKKYSSLELDQEA